jgi:flagellar basal body rod protein FlgB
MTESSGAQQLLLNAQAATNWTRSQLSSLIDQEKRQSGFEIESAVGIVGRMGTLGKDAIKSTSGSVLETGEALKDAESEWSNWSNEEEKKLSKMGSELESNSTLIGNGVNSSLSSLNSSLAGIQAFRDLELGKVRQFMGKVFSSWMTFTDFENKKFEKMGNMTKTSFSFMKQEVDNQAARGYDTLNKTSNSRVKTAADIGKERMNIEDFVKESDFAIGNTTLDLDKERSEFAESKTDITSRISALETEDNKAVEETKTAVANALSKFYSSLDQMEKQVVSDDLV